MAVPVLYSFRRCPYAIRARMALAAASITCEIREVILKNKPPAMLAVSAKGTVPVLQLSCGKILDESLDVMHWALRQSDPENWLNLSPESSDVLINENDQEFKYFLDRYKYFDRFPQHSQTHYRLQAEEFITKLERCLEDHQGKGLITDRLTLADFAIFPFVRQFSKVESSWFQQSEYEHLKTWLAELEKSDRFLSVMKKYSPWKEGDPPIFFAV